MFFFIIPSGESYCNDRSKEFSENKNIYERRAFYYGNYKNHATSCRQRPHRESGDQAKPSHRELLRVAIDNALSQSPADFEELLKLLREYGCEVSKRGKSYRLKLSGWEKAARMDSLGEGYGLEDLQAVLSGKKAHIPRKKTVTQAEPPKVNLLHQAAKNAFDEMGVKKLPKVKELQTEYAKLLEEKKKTYAEYRRSREEMRELLTAKANVDRVLKMEVEQDVEKEKDHSQR